MFVWRLVSGVRSSCDASATKRRCVSSDSSSEPSIVLNDAPSRASSPLPPSGTRSLGSPVSAIRSAVAVSRRTGASVALETSAPDGRRDADAAERDEKEDQPQPVEVVVDRARGRATTTTPPAAAGERRDELAQLERRPSAGAGAVRDDVMSRKKRLALPAATAQHSPVERQRPVTRGRRAVPSVSKTRRGSCRKSGPSAGVRLRVRRRASLCSEPSICD